MMDVVCGLIRDRATIKTRPPPPMAPGMDVDEAYVKYQAEAHERLFLGYTLMAEGRYEDARRCVEEVVELRPSCVQSLYTLTCLAALLQDTRGCSDNLVKAVNATIVRRKHMGLQDTAVDVDVARPMVDRPQPVAKWRSARDKVSRRPPLENFRQLQKQSKASKDVRHRITSGTWTSDDILELVKGVKWVVENTVYPERVERVAELYRCPWLDDAPLVVPNIRRSGSFARRREIVSLQQRDLEPATCAVKLRLRGQPPSAPTFAVLPGVADGRQDGYSTAPGRRRTRKVARRLAPAPSPTVLRDGVRGHAAETPMERVRRTQNSAKCKPLGLVTPTTTDTPSPQATPAHMCTPLYDSLCDSATPLGGESLYLPTLRAAPAGMAPSPSPHGAAHELTWPRCAGAWTDTVGPGSTGRHFPLFNTRKPLRALCVQPERPVALPTLTMSGSRKHSVPRAGREAKGAVEATIVADA